MSFRVNAFPDMTRSDAACALFGTWHAGTPERQQAAIAALTRLSERRAWPTADLLSFSAFPSLDGSCLLTYSQWAAENRSAELARTWMAEVGAEVSGIERTEMTTCRY